MNVPSSDDRLSTILPVRFFPQSRKEMRRWVRKHRGRWENEGHFVRSAVQHFFLVLEREELLKDSMKLRLQKKVRR